MGGVFAKLYDIAMYVKEQSLLHEFFRNLVMDLEVTYFFIYK